jgi:uncharacterized protein (DUF433 family)
MARIEIGRYLASDSRVCGGRLIFRGSRIKVADALEMADDGYSPEEISKQYHGIITPEAVIEALTLVRQGFLKEMSVTRKRAA